MISNRRADIAWSVTSDGRACSSGAAQATRARITKTLREGNFHIPALPQVAIELQQLASRPDADLAAAVKLAYRDPDLAARVLAIASSPAFGARARIADLRQAAARIGLNGMRDAAMGLAMRRIFRAPGPLQERMEAESKRLYVLGCATLYLARTRGFDMMFGFLCGLFADVGRPALLSLLASWGRGQPEWLEQGRIDCALEHLHNEVGAMITAQWELPAAVVAAARDHHDIDPKREPTPLTCAVAVADAAIDAGDEIKQVLDAPGARCIGVTADHLGGLVDTILQAWSE